jgi:hypothetical protein
MSRLPLPVGAQFYLPLNRYAPRPKTDDVVIHCSDTTDLQEISMADIRQWHVKERGWIDTGYHFGITRVGALELGRPWWAMGAGVEGWNAQSVHVVLYGGRGRKGGAEANFTASQFLTLRSLIVTLRDMDPGTERVLGHRDYPGVQKYCPSFDVASWLKREGL